MKVASRTNKEDLMLEHISFHTLVPSVIPACLLQANTESDSWLGCLHTRVCWSLVLRQNRDSSLKITHPVFYTPACLDSRKSILHSAWCRWVSSRTTRDDLISEQIASHSAKLCVITVCSSKTSVGVDLNPGRL